MLSFKFLFCSSPEVPLEEDTDQAKSADTSKQRIAAKNREKEVEVIILYIYIFFFYIQLLVRLDLTFYP